MSGRSRSTPRCSSRGKARPASTTTISSPSSYTVMFLPTSPRPPRGMIRSASLTRLSLRAALERKDVDGEQVTVDTLRADRDRFVLLGERVEGGKVPVLLLVAESEGPLAVDHGELDLVGPDTGQLDDPDRLRDGVPRVALAPCGRSAVRRREHLLDGIRERGERPLGKVLVHDECPVLEGHEGHAVTREGRSVSGDDGIPGSAGPHAHDARNRGPGAERLQHVLEPGHLHGRSREEAESLETAADGFALLVRGLHEREPQAADVVPEEAQRALDGDRVHGRAE